MRRYQMFVDGAFATHDGAYANGEPRLIAYKQGGALGDSVHAPDAETLYVRALRRLT